MKIQIKFSELLKFENWTLYRVKGHYGEVLMIFFQILQETDVTWLKMYYIYLCYVIIFIKKMDPFFPVMLQLNEKESENNEVEDNVVPDAEMFADDPIETMAIDEAIRHMDPFFLSCSSRNRGSMAVAIKCNLDSVTFGYWRLGLPPRK